MTELTPTNKLRWVLSPTKRLQQLWEYMPGTDEEEYQWRDIEEVQEE